MPSGLELCQVLDKHSSACYSLLPLSTSIQKSGDVFRCVSDCVRSFYILGLPFAMTLTYLPDSSPAVFNRMLVFISPVLQRADFLWSCSFPLSRLAFGVRWLDSALLACGFDAGPGLLMR